MKKDNFYQKNYFASHKKLYLAQDSVFWKRIDLILKYLKPGPEDIILECGCGVAATALELAKRSRKVMAIDSSSLAIKLAKDFTQKNAPGLTNLEITKADLTNLPFADGTFDKVCFSEIVEHLESPEMALKEIARVTKKEGIVFISTWPNAGNIFWRFRYKVGLGSWEDFNPQSPDSLKRLLTSCGLEIKLLKVKDFYIPGLIPLLIFIFKRGKRLNAIINNLERCFTKDIWASYFGSVIIAVARKE